MCSPHYETMEVPRQCAVVGSTVKYNDHIYKVNSNTRGQIVVSSACKKFIVRDALVEILLNRKGEPIIN